MKVFVTSFSSKLILSSIWLMLVQLNPTRYLLYFILHNTCTKQAIKN